MNSSARLESQGVSRESLARGGSILSKIATHGVVKQEDPEDEKEIISQMEALIPEHPNTLRPYVQPLCCSGQALKQKMAAIRSAKDSSGHGLLHVSRDSVTLS